MADRGGSGVRIRTLGIPCLNRGDMLLRCVLSVDHPVESLFVINDGRDPGVAAAAERIRARDIPNRGLFAGIRVESHDRLGCGPAWNRIVRTSPGAWMLAASDIQFAAGSVRKVAEALASHQDASIVCAFGYNVFVLTEAGRDRAGLFDENFYPAYYEDIDHFRRIALSGAKAVDAPGFKCVHGEAPSWGSTTVNSNPEFQRKNGVTFGNLRDYYVRKWGGEPGKETFGRPFDRDLPFQHWEIDPDLRKKNSIW
jgi:GT2 family glycosyltransferase